jgi:superfamily II DNA or RNA helicase
MLFTHRVEHAMRIDASLSARRIKTGIMLGGPEWRARFDEARAGLLDGTVKAVAGTIQAVGTGTDLPSLSRGILMTPVGANRQLFGQIRGRLCRPGSRDAVLYVLWDWRVQGKTTLKRLISWNQNVLVRAIGGEWIDATTYRLEEQHAKTSD